MYESNQTVRSARDAYFTANGFGAEGYEAPTVTFSVWGLPVSIPNTEGRKQVVPLHDLHHVATGFASDWVGEAEIGTFELRAGCTTLASYVLNFAAAAIGLVIAPRRVIAAWRRSAGCRSLYRAGIPYEELLQMSVGELRAVAGVPDDGLA